MAADSVRRTPSTDVSERKYQLLSRGSVRLFADSRGFCVSDDVIRILTEDVNYRLREIVSEATQYMKHSKRSYLCTLDVSHALIDSNVNGVIADSSNGKSGQYIHLPELNIHCYKDELVSLEELVKRKLTDKQASTTSICVEQEWLNVKSHLNQPSMDAMKCMASYFTEITEAACSADTQVRHTALADIITNPRVSYIKEQLLSFIDRWCTACLDSKRSLRHVLELMDALTNNVTVLFTVSPMLDHIISVLLDKVILNATSDASTLTDDQVYASNILAKCLQNPSNTADKSKLVVKCSSVLRDSSVSSSQLHGALRLVTALCPSVLMKTINENTISSWLESRKYKPCQVLHVQAAIFDGLTCVLRDAERCLQTVHLEKVLAWAQIVLSSCSLMYAHALGYFTNSYINLMTTCQKAARRSHPGVCRSGINVLSASDVFEDKPTIKRCNIYVSYGTPRKPNDKKTANNSIDCPSTFKFSKTYRRYLAYKHNKRLKPKEISETSGPNIIIL